MAIADVRFLSGPNRWSDRPTMVISVSDSVSRRLHMDSTFHARWQRFVARLPAEATLVGLPPDTHRADFIPQLVLQLQRHCGELVAETVLHEEANGLRFGIEFAEEETARRCVVLAEELVTAAVSDQPFSLEQSLTDLRAFADEQRLGRTTAAIVEAAQRLGVPVHRLDQEGLVQLGHGAQQQRIKAATSCQTGFLAEWISRDKWLTKSLLQKLGVPVSQGRTVGSAVEAWDVANELGLPVVVKPRDADFGNGVALRLDSREAIVAAYDSARRYSNGVLVEKYLAGFHHRVLVIGNRIIAALRREPAHVIGNGSSSIETLIALANRDPRRGATDDRTTPWCWLPTDGETLVSLARQNLSLGSIPPCGQRIVLCWNPSDWMGDSIYDVTDDIDPQVAEALIDAVEMIGLDIAGIDLIADNLRIPFAQQEAGILEINAEPSLLIHMRGTLTRAPNKVSEAIIRHLFPTPAASRIPIAAVLSNGANCEATTVARSLQNNWRPDRQTGLATCDGAWLGRRRLRTGRCDNRLGVETLLLHPRVEAAVCELSFESLENEGLPFDHCDLLIVVGSTATVDPTLVDLAVRNAGKVVFVEHGSSTNFRTNIVPELVTV